MVASVHPGSIIKYKMPEDPFVRGSGSDEKIFEVKAIKDDKLYGVELSDIDKVIEDETPYSEKPKFEIIA